MNTHFHPDLFKFLRQLKRHNDRAWFLNNKPRYEEQYKTAMLRFIADLEPHLHKLNPKLKVDAKSMLRIYRDTRFSPNKAPYKTHASAHFPFWLPKQALQTPGFYLHISPEESFAGSGMWHPDSRALAQIRHHIMQNPERWKKLAKLHLGGESLKRPPRGYDPNHPLIEDLKRKDFTATVTFTERQVCSRNFLKDYVAACRKMAPLVGFLCEAIGYKW